MKCGKGQENAEEFDRGRCLAPRAASVQLYLGELEGQEAKAARTEWRREVNTALGEVARLALLEGQVSGHWG